MPTDPLKPCPWCGSRAQIDRISGFAECCCADCEGASSILEPAEWNKRPLEDMLVDALSGMLDMLKPDSLGLMPSDSAKARYIHEARVAIAKARGEQS